MCLAKQLSRKCVSNALIVSLGRDSKISHCDMKVPEQIMSAFQTRKDNQIMGLEILSIALGMALE